MRLLFCIKGLKYPGGGAERVLAEVTGGLVDRGHKVAILTFDLPKGSPYYRLHSGVERIELGLSSAAKPSTLGMTLRRLPAIRAAVLRYSPDIVIGFMNSMFVPLAFALLGSGLPLIASEHTSYEHYRKHPLQAWLLRLIPGLVNGITCVSEEVRLTFPPPLRAFMSVVPNPVSIVATVRSDVLAASRKRKLLLAVGRLDPNKDHATLINAFAQIATDAPDWDLRIVGDGELRRKLESQIERLGLVNRISLPGAVTDICSEYQNAQLFVLPSRYESFSLTTAEALMHHLPVVAFSDCLGANTLIEPMTNGILVSPQPDRASALASALLPLMQSPERRNLLASGYIFRPECRLEYVLDRWEEMLRQPQPRH